MVSDSLDISLSDEKSIANDDDDDDEDNHSPSELDVPAQVVAEHVDTTLDNLSNKKSKIPPMGEPCGPKYKRQRIFQRVGKIWGKYREIKYKEKKTWIFHIVAQQSKKNITVGVDSRRSRSFLYHLPNQSCSAQQVCKGFFLTTLGYHPKNDRLIVTLMGLSITTKLIPQKDQNKASASKLNMNPILQHIGSFSPQISHYRREHVPHHLCLPSDVNIRFMHNDCKENNKVMKPIARR